MAGAGPTSAQGTPTEGDIPSLWLLAPPSAVRDHFVMGVRTDCRHYIRRTTQGGELLQRCRLGVAEEGVFACPEGCLFFEERVVSTVGWSAGTDQQMSNTASGLAASPPLGKRAGGSPRGAKGKKKGRRPR
ncbi:MAG TPA: hypothetical protein VME20_08450 [Acidimicrobiales bacterium]|nr:hypothetical protein [Acidimicrobiales bacterium]